MLMMLMMCACFSNSMTVSISNQMTNLMGWTAGEGNPCAQGDYPSSLMGAVGFSGKKCYLHDLEVVCCFWEGFFKLKTPFCQAIGVNKNGSDFFLRFGNTEVSTKCARLLRSVAPIF